MRRKFKIVQKCGRNRIGRFVGKRRGVATVFLVYRLKLARQTIRSQF